MNEDHLATAVADFVAHKRALGRVHRTEEVTLRLLLVVADQHGITDLHQLTAALLDEFAALRPRPRARSFNHFNHRLGYWAATWSTKYPVQSLQSRQAVRSEAMRRWMQLGIPPRHPQREWRRLAGFGRSPSR
jgi:hypothetical protein